MPSNLRSQVARDRWPESDIRMRTDHNQLCITPIGADREANCAWTAPVMTALASAKPMKMLLKIDPVRKKLMVRMTAPRSARALMPPKRPASSLVPQLKNCAVDKLQSCLEAAEKNRRSSHGLIVASSHFSAIIAASAHRADCRAAARSRIGNGRKPQRRFRRAQRDRARSPATQARARRPIYSKSSNKKSAPPNGRAVSACHFPIIIFDTRKSPAAVVSATKGLVELNC
jgi:hypothetical protein